MKYENRSNYHNSDDIDHLTLSVSQKEIHGYTFKKFVFEYSNLIANELTFLNKNLKIPAKPAAFIKTKNYNLLLNNGVLINFDNNFQIISTDKIELENLNYNLYFGGILNATLLENNNLIIIPNIKRINDKNYYYLSVVDAHSLNIIIEHKLLELTDNEGEFGGGLASDDDFIYLAIGINGKGQVDDHTHNAQLNDSLFGKILKIKRDSLKDKLQLNIYSIGHKNPQGMLFLNNNLLSVEHSLIGGDEINQIIENGNYGYDEFGYTFFYLNDEVYPLNKKSLEFKEPLFYFSPSAALTDINKCSFDKQNDKFNYLPCIFVSSLKDQSIYILKLKNNGKNQNDLKVISVEKIQLDERVRRIFSEKNKVVFLSDSLKLIVLEFKIK